MSTLTVSSGKLLTMARAEFLTALATAEMKSKPDLLQEIRATAIADALEPIAEHLSRLSIEVLAYQEVLHAAANHFYGVDFGIAQDLCNKAHQKFGRQDEVDAAKETARAFMGRLTENFDSLALSQFDIFAMFDHFRHDKKAAGEGSR